MRVTAGARWIVLATQNAHLPAEVKRDSPRLFNRLGIPGAKLGSNTHDTRANAVAAPARPMRGAPIPSTLNAAGRALR